MRHETAEEFLSDEKKSHKYVLSHQQKDSPKLQKTA